jgi:hypothetical protein
MEVPIATGVIRIFFRDQSVFQGWPVLHMEAARKFDF